MKDLRRWLTTNGQVGEVPVWYRLLSAAKYLGIDPREMADVPWRYVRQAEAASAAEAWADNQRAPKGVPGVE